MLKEFATKIFRREFVSKINKKWNPNKIFSKKENKKEETFLFIIK